MTVITGGGGSAEVDKALGALRGSPVPESGQDVCHYHVAVRTPQMGSGNVSGYFAVFVLQDPSVVAVFTRVRFRSLYINMASAGSILSHQVVRSTYNNQSAPSLLMGNMVQLTPGKKRRSYPDAKGTFGAMTVATTMPTLASSPVGGSYYVLRSATIRDVVNASSGGGVAAYPIDYPEAAGNNPRLRANFVVHPQQLLTFHAGPPNNVTMFWRICLDLAWTEYPASRYKAVR